MDFAEGVYLSEAQNPIHTSLREGGGRVEPERRLEGQQFTNLGQKYLPNWLYLQSVNFCRKDPLTTGQLF